MGGSGADGFEDGAEGAGAGQACGADDGARRRLALSGPHRAIAVRHLALDDGRAQCPLAGVIGGIDQTGMVEKDQELIASDLGLQLAPSRANA